MAEVGGGKWEAAGQVDCCYYVLVLAVGGYQVRCSKHCPAVQVLACWFIKMLSEYLGGVG